MASHRLAGIVLAVSLGWSGLAHSQTVVTVTGSDLAPYKEALAGFGESFGGTVPAVAMGGNGPQIHSQTRIVVAFGGRAARARYPNDVTVIYCLAPGIRIDPAGRRGAVIRIDMLPAPRTVLERLREIQPGLKRLAVLWVSETFGSYVREMQAVAPAGLTVRSERVTGPGEVPDRLRSLRADAEALWAPLDPALLNASTLMVLRDFSEATRIPLYAPSVGLLEQAGVASVGASFRQIGRAAAEAARQALQGGEVGEHMFPGTSETVISRAAADRIGMRIPADALRKVDRVIP